ncbi:MAG: membrane protein of unknown function [Candidatus Thorarchaeota archaeon]|nr:MAG: membrane protein of unknown function [Candidatus Thorarchaeota archaeon]
MEDSPLILPSSIFYNLILLSSIVIWSFLSAYIAQYVLLDLIFINWIIPASGLILILIPMVFVIVWAEKNKIELLDVEWDFKKREVAYSEYKSMAYEYAKVYSGIIQTVDYLWLSISIAAALITLFVPFLMAFGPILTLQFAPFVFGFSMIMYGVSLSVFLRSFVPAPISSEFPYTPARKLRDAVSLFISTPSLSWTGVRLDIGRYGDYYVMEDLKVIGRIDSLESAACLVAELDQSGQVLRINSELNFEEAPTIAPLESNISPETVQHLVIEIIKIYVSIRGSNELIDEVLAELSIDFIKDTG